MLKRLFVFLFVLSTLTLIALAPMNVKPALENTTNLQVTVVATVGVATAAPLLGGSAPVTGMQPSTLIIIGLLIVIGLAVVIGGMGLMNRPT